LLIGDSGPRAASLVPVFAPGSLTVVWKPEISSDLRFIGNLNFSIDPFENFGSDQFSETTKLYDWAFFSSQPN
jgi:hypothetical protein